MRDIFFSEKLYKIFGNDDIKENVITKFLTSCILDDYNFIELESIDTISFISNSKLENLHKKHVKEVNLYERLQFDSYINSSRPEFWNTYRSTIKIGRYVKKLILAKHNVDTWNYVKTNYISNLRYNGVVNPKLPNDDKLVELFVNNFKAVAKRSLDKNLYDKIKIVSGKEIKKWYLSNNYSIIKGSLGNSCMRYEKCQDFFDVYIQNPEFCQLIIYQETSPDKIDMRALLWTLPNGSKYMDRIYATCDSDAIILMNYAKENGWRYYDENSVNDDFHSNMYIETAEIYDMYPYMDTFKYLDTDSKRYYTYYKRNCYELENQDGTWDET